MKMKVKIQVNMTHQQMSGLQLACPTDMGTLFSVLSPQRRTRRTISAQEPALKSRDLAAGHTPASVCVQHHRHQIHGACSLHTDVQLLSSRNLGVVA